MTSFLAEGVKIIYRYTYGLLKYLKDYIKSIDNEDTLIKQLRETAKMITDNQGLKKVAFNYNLKFQHTQFHRANVDYE